MLIFAAASSQKINIIENYNPDYTINYKDNNLKNEIKNLTGNKGVDVVFDPVGGEFFDQALSSLDWGEVSNFGFVGGIPQIPSNRLLVKHRSAIGCSLRFLKIMIKKNTHSVKKLFEWYESGLIKPFISELFNLDAQKALNILKDRKALNCITNLAITSLPYLR